MKPLDRYRRQAEEGRGASAREEEVLIRAHLDLLVLLARKVLAVSPRAQAVLSEEDLVSVGCMALLSARSGFDPERGVSFRTYAGIRVRGAMLDELRALDFLPRRVRSAARRLEVAREELTARLGRPPEPLELAEAMGMSVEDLARREDATAAVRWLELEDAAAVLVSEAPTPEEVATWKGERAVLVRAIEGLRERDRILLDLYYVQELSMREIAEVFEVSVPRVSQLHSAALVRLRRSLAAVEAGDPADGAEPAG